MSKQPIKPRIYVASLSDYNAGRLHGRWIEARQTADELFDEVHEMLAESPEPIAEEWAIHDYEGFEDLLLSEYQDLAHIAEVAALMAEHGPVVAGLVNHLGGLRNLDEAKLYITDAYQGDYESLTDYASQFVDDAYAHVIHSLPEILRFNIDYEGIGHDMELSGDIFTVEVDHRVHVFWSQV